MIMEEAHKRGYGLAGHYLDTDEHESILNHCRDGLNKNIFFSHDFAKAFWGENRWRHERVTIKKKENITTCKSHGVGFTRPEHTKMQRYRVWGWEHHLQQMVLEEDPIKYLEQFINE